MKKALVPSSIHILLLALYSLIVFVNTSEYTITLWVAYGFVVLSFISSFACWIDFSKDNNEHGGFYAISQKVIGTIYLVVGILSSSLLIAFSASVKTMVTLQAILFIVFLIVLILIKSAVKYIKSMDRCNYIKQRE